MCTYITLHKHNIVTLQQNGLKKLHCWMLYLNDQIGAISTKKNTFKFISMVCSCVFHAHILHTICHTLCKTHPQLSGAIIWKIFNNKEFFIIHAYHQWKILIVGVIECFLQEAQAWKTYFIFYTPSDMDNYNLHKFHKLCNWVVRRWLAFTSFHNRVKGFKSKGGNISTLLLLLITILNISCYKSSSQQSNKASNASSHPPPLLISPHKRIFQDIKVFHERFFTPHLHPLLWGYNTHNIKQWLL